MAKKLMLFAVSFMIILILLGAYNVHLNNKDAAWPDDEVIDSALVRSIEWLHRNQSLIETRHNPGLWWMLKEASDISSKPELIEIYTHYKENYLDKRPPNIWTPYFQPHFKPKVPDITEILELDKYQIFFVYALSCGHGLAEEPLVRKQFEADFCSPYLFHPRCVTHQQMGVRLLQRGNCGYQEELAALSSELVNIIHTEISWDFRVGDAYLQRNLMLAESERLDLIKPVWIQRILDAQNPDGGWDDIHPVLPLGWNITVGLSSKGPVIKKQVSKFHATAQGIWLLTLLQHQNTSEIPQMGTASY